jgi:hypothetical protein
MRKVFIVAALLGVATGARAEEMDWRTEAAQALIQSSLATASDMCASFGFTRMKLPPPAVMRGRIGAHLLASTAPEVELNRWVEVVMAANQLRVGADDPVRLERGMEALTAAQADPAAFGPARERFVDIAMGPILAAVDACTRAAADSFISTNYFTGHAKGLGEYEESFRARFAEILKKMAEKKAEPAAARNSGTQY